MLSPYQIGMNSTKKFISHESTTTLHKIGADVCQMKRSSNLQSMGGRTLFVRLNNSASVDFWVLGLKFILASHSNRASYIDRAPTIMYQLYGRMNSF